MPPGKVLLRSEGLVSCEKDVDPVLFRYAQQLTVFEPCPSHVSDGDNVVWLQKLSQCVIKIFVEQHPSRLGLPSLSVRKFDQTLNLSDGQGWETLAEFFKRLAKIVTIDNRIRKNARPTHNGPTGYLPRDYFD
jgi:hypothetical protein